MANQIVKTLLLNIFLISSFTVFDGHANCSDINITGEQMSCLADLGVRNQQNLNNCYSQAASQAFDCYQSKDALDLQKHQTSTLMTAITSTNNQQIRSIFGANNDIGFGFFCNAVKNLNEYGSCNYLEVDKKLKDQQKTYDFLKELYRSKGDTSSQDLYAKLNQHLDSETLLEKSISFSDFENWLGSSKDYTMFLYNIFGQLCEGNQIKSLSKVQCKNIINTTFTKESIRKSIEDKLIEKIPVGLSFNSCILRAGNSWKDECKLLRKFGHVALIVGSRKKGDSCQYLLKDSFGVFSSTMHSPDWEPIKSLGAFWIDEDAIFKSAISFSILK